MTKMITSLIERVRRKDAPEDIEAQVRAQQNLEYRATQLLARANEPRRAA